MPTVSGGGKVNLSVRRAELADVADLVLLMHDFYAEANYSLDHSWARASFLQLLARPELGCVWLVHSGLVPCPLDMRCSLSATPWSMAA
jgi:hypothetical protein